MTLGLLRRLPDVNDRSGTDPEITPASIETANAALAQAAYLPDESEYPDASDDERVVRTFLGCRRARVGRTFVPTSALADHPIRIATAINRELARMMTEALPPGRRKQIYQQGIDAFVDLQAFRDDEDAAIVASAQATAISLVRGERSIVGALLAIQHRPVPIGSARAAYDAVDAYRERQVGGFLALASWPISAGMGFVVGSILVRPSLVVAVALLAGWLAAPAVGVVGGSIGSLIDRASLRSNHVLLVRLGRFASGVGLLFVLIAPAAIALIALAAVGTTDLP